MIEAPLLAPSAAVEILSPDDRQANVAHKIDVYLRAGSDVVVIVDPSTRTIETHDSDGVRRFSGNDTFSHDALPGFTFALSELFAVLDLPARPRGR